LDVLSESEAKAGDVYFLPSGRVHSLGEGTFVAEIQETSDLLIAFTTSDVWMHRASHASCT
ncbi:MAG: hypothetical protein II570_09885, partial [Bacteroidaceae bacterium]|nr:hypothetical protein [Bacteroidaceae bacterium]